MAEDGVNPLDEVGLAAVLEALPDGVVVLDAQVRVVWVNAEFRRLTGWALAEVVGRSGLDLLDPAQLADALEALSIVRESRNLLPPGAYRLAHRDGSFVTFELHAAPIDPTDPASLTAMMVRELEYQTTETAGVELLSAGGPIEDMASFIVHRIGWSAGTMAIVFDEEVSGERRSVNVDLPAELDGTITPGDGPAPWDEVAANGFPVERTIDEFPASLQPAMRAAGFVQCTVDTVPDPGGRDALVVLWFREDAPTSYRFLFKEEPRYLLLRLALERRHYQAALRRAATQDHLTGLANRARFFEAIDAATDQHCALLYLDLDDFKPVNDQHGHVAGDLVLTEIGRRLQAAVRPGDLVARLGGDEFAVFCPGIEREADATELAARIHETITWPIEVHDVEVRVGASIGVAVTADGLSDATKLLDAADQLLYELKRDGKDGWRARVLS